MDSNTDTMKEADASGPAIVADKAIGRRQSAFARRKSSVIVDETPQAVIEASQLNAADRRLAEMGYVQVSMRSNPLRDPC